MSECLTQESLKHVLHYDPDTGAWTWLVRRGGTANAGSIAGWIENSTGYLRITVLGRREYAHRLAFLYMEGSLPENDVDHRNRNPGDCRWNNLRRATTSQNLANRPIRTNNSCGVKGVRKRHNLWEARLSKNGSLVYRSVHPSREEAAAAYAAAAKEHFGEFARLS